MIYRAETERLMLREFHPESDAEPMFLLNEDPEVMKYTGDKRFTSVEDSLQFLRNYSDYEKNGIGRWTAELKSTGEILGWCGLKFHNQEGFIDIGYRLFQKYWNQGYATESAFEALKYGFQVKNYNEIIGRAHHENLASIRVFEKLGMRKIDVKTFDDYCDVEYAISKADFLNSL